MNIERIKDFGFGTVIPALLILIIGIIVIKVVMKGISKGLERTKSIDASLYTFVMNASRIVLWVVLIMIVANKFGIDTTSIITIFAAAGAAVALALQGSLSNLASGILIIFTKPFKHGDYIAGGGSEGTVESIDLLYTTIITADNKMVNIPNSALTNSTIVNWTKSGSRRIDIKIGVAYDSDLEKAKNVLIEIAKNCGYYLPNRELVCHIVEYADCAIILQLRGWVEPAGYWPAYFAVHDNIKSAFDAAGIEIPFPQLDVAIKK